ncbi:branched chain amino acid aminotransferase [Halioglobus japonicus]|uniref:Branched-chain-amino-acid aminotransferase n=1 Tax=Halioglobus japonicus TaxID=930805 RepID=A0AAP8SMF4_9GAMM|nr:branched-chain amino acid aminotransferase [Halioglobus japonicus]AQA17581.1 branched chain amino acid aminotransferase [Halioglobus japonicus]PLW85517.1 branched-chain amino acid aminotransferase [Halioglobus japonicus]GHD16077.1 branched chain amino acid aminotransferase [Halioglobus japonicus]
MAAFGTEFTDKMVINHYADGQWSGLAVVPVEPFNLHPATHVLHYASECFEGLKAYRTESGDIHLFRPDRHVARLLRSAAQLLLPVPDEATLLASLHKAVAEVSDQIPAYPGSLYLRPTLFGTEEDIGAAARPTQKAIYYVLTSPVGDYFAGGLKPLRVKVDDQAQRSTPNFGEVKTGGNYAAAMRQVVRAREEMGADQVLFAPGGIVQETGAANFVLIENGELLTKPLDGSILPGVTRDSILTLAAAAGLTVMERDFDVAELLERAPRGEAALTGTAAVLTPVGELVYNGETIQVGDGDMGPWSSKLREQLCAIQSGTAEDPHGWRVALAS